MEAKIQILTGDKLSYVNVDEFINLIRNELKTNSFTENTPQINSVETKFLKIQEVCKILHITKPTVYHWAEKGILKPIKIQSRIYFDKDDIISLSQENKKG